MPNYWVVGANWEGEDQTDRFCKTGFGELGYSDLQKSRMAAFRDKMVAGDSKDKKIYVNWVLINLSRYVPSKGCFSAIRKSFTVENNFEWLGLVFRL